MTGPLCTENGCDLDAEAYRVDDKSVKLCHPHAQDFVEEWGGSEHQLEPIEDLEA